MARSEEDEDHAAALDEAIHSDEEESAPDDSDDDEQPVAPNKKKRYPPKKLAKDTVQLFAFDPTAVPLAEVLGRTSRPKRKLKAVARFDSQSYDNARRGPNSCRTGHGFACPRCSTTCSYDSRSCGGCGLEVYYEAGVGVVVLKERSEVTGNAKKPKRSAGEEGQQKQQKRGRKAEAKKAKKVEPKGAKRRGRPPKSAKRSNSAPAAAPEPSVPDGPTPHQLGGKRFAGKSMGKTLPGQSMGKTLPLHHAASDDSDSDDDSEEEEARTSATATRAPRAAHKGTKGTAKGQAKGRGRGVPRPVVAFWEKRPFMMKEYPRLENAKEELKASYQTIREKRDWNLEHTVPKRRNKGKFMHYDFRDADDVRTARRWQCHLLAVAHADFDACDSLVEAREAPTWPVRLADAHHRMRMGRRIVAFLREHAMGRPYRVRPGGGKGAPSGAPAISVPHVSFAHGVFLPNAQRKAAHDEGHNGDAPDDDDDVAAKDAIVASIKGRAFGGRASSHSSISSGEGMALEVNSAVMDGGSLGTEDLGHFGRIPHGIGDGEDMVHQLNEDFPPEDHPPLGISAVTTEPKDGGTTRLREVERTLQSVQEEKKELQIKYDALLKKSMETEEELRGTISNLKATPEKEGGGKASSAALSEREDLVSVRVERDELKRQLEKAKKELKAKGKKGTAKATASKSLKQQAGEASSDAELSKQLSSVTAEKANVTKKLAAAKVEVSSLREAKETQRAKISQLESEVQSLTTQRDEANARASKSKPSRWGNRADEVLRSERDELASNLDESKKTIARLEGEKAGMAAKASSLEHTVETLRGRNESLTAELNNAARRQRGKKTGEPTMPLDFAAREAKYKSTIANLEGKIEQQKEHEQSMNDIREMSEELIKSLEKQVAHLQSEKDELAAKMEEHQSKWQSAIKTLTNERNAAQARVREILAEQFNIEEAAAAINSEKEVLVAKIDECMARLYSEKDDSSTEGSAGAAVHIKDPSSALGKVQVQLQDKEAEVKKLVNDKEKLEAYTKQTLLIFQQKYFATTQEYKAQLEEKNRRIQGLETELSNRKAEVPYSVNMPAAQAGAGIHADQTSDTTVADDGSDLKAQNVVGV